MDKIEYLNSFGEEQGSFVRYFMQQNLTSGVKVPDIVDKIGVMDHIPINRKKKFKDESLDLSFYYQNDKYFVKDGFVVIENVQKEIYKNQNIFLFFLVL